MKYKKNLTNTILAFAVLLIFGYFVFIFANPDSWEPQDIRLIGVSEDTLHYIDGQYVGVGSSVCVPQVKQGRHRIRQVKSSGETTEFTAYVRDVTIDIPVDILGTNDSTAHSRISLSNCSSIN